MPAARSIVLLAACSLDGRIADAAGGVGWLAPFEAAGDHGLGEFQAGVARVVMGRSTYEQVRGFGAWPYEALPTTVLTRRALPGAPAGVVAARGDAAAVARAWSGTVWLNGGASVFAAFLAADLVDRLEMCLVPALLGAGPALLPAATRRTPRLAGVRRWPSGLVRLSYVFGPAAP